MSEILEIVMLVAFGISWPISLIKNIKSKSTKGVSLVFYLLVLFGYVAGIISKFTNEAYMASISTKWYVLIFYFLNFTTVGLNIIVYLYNRHLEKTNAINEA